MSELQNNDLVSKLWTASPVEPTQSNQINLSDSGEGVSSIQVNLNEEPSLAPNTSQENIWAEVTLPSKDEVNDVGISPTEVPLTPVVQQNNIENSNSVEPIKDVEVENIVPNNAIPSQPSSINWAVAGNSVNKVVNANPQKVSNISKRNPKAEYWKWLASGILVSLWLIAIWLVLFDHWSLLASAANGIKLTDNDTTNEVVKMEDALAFSDSVSDSYIDGIIGESEETLDVSEVEDLELANQTWVDNKDLESDNILEGENLEDSLVDNELNNEELDENQVELSDEENDEDLDEDTKVVAKNDLDDNSSVDTNQKSDNNSSKNKMAGSIVSIFDNMDEDLDSDESEDVETNTTSISFKHVDNVEDANWVMSANCSNLHCGDLSEANLNELTLCTDFKQKDGMEDEALRIGNNWVCRYKDISELVYVEL